MSTPNKTRGEYRPIYESLFHSPEYGQLSADAKLVFLTLKGLSGPLGVKSWPGLDGTLSELCKIPSRRCRTAVEELRERGWIEREGAVVWVVNGLKFEPSISTGAKHRAFVRKTLAGLPKCDLLDRFQAKYADHLSEPTSEGLHNSPRDRVSHSPYVTTTPPPSPSPTTTATTPSLFSSGEETNAADAAASGVGNALRPRKRGERRPAAEPRAESKPSPFDQAHCARLYDAWVAALGAVEYARFRKAFAPVYSAVIRGAENGSALVTATELDEAFHNALSHAPRGPAFRFFTPECCAKLLVGIARVRSSLVHDPAAAMNQTFEMIHGKKMSSPLTKAS